MENTYGSTPGSTGTGGAGGQVMDQVSGTAQNAVQKTKEMAGQVTSQVREQVKTQLSSQKDVAADKLGSLAEALRQTGQQLEGQEQAAVGQAAVRAADMVNNVSSYLRDRNIEDMVYEVEDFARNNPAVFLGGAFALGFIAGRFLKSSSPRRSTRYEQYDRQGEGTYGPYEAGYAGSYGSGYTESYGASGTYGTGTGYETSDSERYGRSHVTSGGEISEAELPPAVTASGRERKNPYPNRETGSTDTSEGQDTTGTL